MTASLEHPGGQRSDRRPNGLRAMTYRLMSRLAAMARPQPPATAYLGKRAALSRAIAAVPHPGGAVRVWLYVDAVLVHAVWVCVLEDAQAVRMVEVEARTGEVQLAVTVLDRPGPHAGPAGPPAHRPLEALLSSRCTGSRAGADAAARRSPRTPACRDRRREA